MPPITVLLLAAGLAIAAEKDDCRPVEAGTASAAAPAPYTLSTDARVELLSVVQALADASESHPYAAERPRFAKLKSHDAVRRYARWLEKGVPARTALEVLLYASPPPELALPDASVFPSGAADPVGGVEELAAFLAELRTFVREARFEAYLKSRKPALDKEVAEVRRELETSITPEQMSAYLGVPFRLPHAVVLSPGYSDAQSQESMLWTPTGVTTVRYKTGGAYHLTQLGMSLPHEMAHDVTQPWSRGASDKLSSAGPIPSGCEMLGPRDWGACFDEHLVRALEFRLLRQAGKETSELDRGEGRYPYQEALAARLGEYEARRSCFPTLLDFYPRLVDAVKDAAASARKAESKAARR